MKRNAFTLVELIFTIVIIGVLAAVAIPQFRNLKQNAEVKTVIKTTYDTAQNAATASISQIDLDNNTTFTLSDIVTVRGKGWTSNGNTISYFDPANGSLVAGIVLNPTTRTVNYAILCGGFNDDLSETRCRNDLNSTNTTDTTQELNATITF